LERLNVADLDKWTGAVRPIFFSDWVTRRVCEKIAQSVTQTIFVKIDTQPELWLYVEVAKKYGLLLQIKNCPEKTIAR
jgi:hypothetical protein